MKYVILLRGINVGGNHRVPKAEFRQVLEEAGFSDVLIYLNSGNAIAEHRLAPSGETLQKAFEKHFGFAIPTLILPGDKAQKIAAAIPSEWTNDSPGPDRHGQKSDVIYLFDGINAPDILEKLGYKPEIETMIYVDGAVVANILRLNQSKGSIQKIIGTGLYSQVTIRNVNTARKLAELAAE